MKGFIAVLAVTLALPAGALAADRDMRIAQRDQAPGSALGVAPPELRTPGSIAAASDLRAPDQRDRSTLPARVPAKGTDVAAPDQQIHASGPHTVVVPASARQAGDTDWGDAGLGAAAALGLAAIALAAGITIRRRTTRRGSVLAG
jgi:hypothetical protein